jgi:hypothetical protein
VTRLFITMAVVLATGVFAVGANAANVHKTVICHKGHTLSVDAHALKGHLKHGDKLGACAVNHPPVDPPGGDDDGVIPVTPDTFLQVNRILACADRPVLRVADNTMGIAVDLTVEVFNSGIYSGVKFTVARLYVGVGATCDNLGGKYQGFIKDGYPVWSNLSL